LQTIRIKIISAAVVLFISALACNALAGKPTVSNIRMATDDTGKTSTILYSPSDDFYVFADLSGIKTGSIVEAKWYAINATGLVTNSEINVSDYTYQPGIAFIYFKLTTNDGSDWPGGSYKVELYLDGVLTGEQTFAVQ
jgi:hypothetical protein